MSKTGSVLFKVLCTGPLLAMLLVSAARADMVPDLHAATVPVADRSSSALAAASREAMAEVLVKVSGSFDLLQNPAITQALRESRSQVQQYSFVRGADVLSARFEFDAAYITGLVTTAGAPLWTANRPPVLAWVVLEGEQGRYFLNPDSAPEQAQQLVAAFARRGVTLQLPLYDLSDTAAVSVADAWRLDGSAITGASARYGVNNVLAGRLAVSAAGQGFGDWSYLYGDTRLQRSVTAADFVDFASSGAALVADDMAARYAVVATGTEQGFVRMSISGVAGYSDYAAIVSWLEGLELIERANVEQVAGDRIELRLQTQADAVQLASIIELNSRLQPVSDGLAAEQLSPQLSYQWLK